MTDAIRPPMESALPCAAHRYHYPRPAYTELHHLIPQAWQRVWFPEGHRAGVYPTTLEQADRGVMEARYFPKEGLWAPKTVPLCPTGHRNVHVLIVTMMRAVEASGVDEPLEGWVAVGGRVTQEKRIAYQALAGFRDEGGSLLHLCEMGQYGRA